MFARLLYATRRRTLKTPVLGITGNLPQDGASYVQVLEGGREVVNTLYNRIVRGGAVLR